MWFIWEWVNETDGEGTWRGRNQGIRVLKVSPIKTWKSFRKMVRKEKRNENQNFTDCMNMMKTETDERADRN